MYSDWVMVTKFYVKTLMTSTTIISEKLITLAPVALDSRNGRQTNVRVKMVVPEVMQSMVFLYPR